MRGQTLSIRVITDTYMRLQRSTNTSTSLARHGRTRCKVDWIYHDTDECLRAGHHYEVRVNKETKNPRIVEVIAELAR